MTSPVVHQLVKLPIGSPGYTGVADPPRTWCGVPTDTSDAYRWDPAEVTCPACKAPSGPHRPQPTQLELLGLAIRHNGRTVHLRSMEARPGRDPESFTLNPDAGTNITVIIGDRDRVYAEAQAYDERSGAYTPGGEPS